jgi:hypothetical protein
MPCPDWNAEMTKPAVFAPAVAALLLLSACSPGRDEAVDEQEIAEPAAPGPAVKSPAPAEVAEPDKPDPAPMESGIPAALQGKWGLKPGDCAGGSHVSEGLLEIGRDKLEFYESVATLGKIAERDTNRLRANFAFSGEGEQWTLDMLLATEDGGATLVRRDYGPDAMPGAITYQKCR